METTQAPVPGNAPFRNFSLTLTPTGFTGVVQLREGTAGRTFTIDCSNGQLVVDGRPAQSVNIGHDDITGEIEVIR
jgi:hypothetical protein